MAVRTRRYSSSLIRTVVSETSSWLCCLKLSFLERGSPGETSDPLSLSVYRTSSLGFGVSPEKRLCIRGVPLGQDCKWILVHLLIGKDGK